MPIVTPVGADPTHEAEKLTGELNPPNEFTSTEVPPLSPGITDTVDEEEVSEKSGGTTTSGTGASTDGVPSIATIISVECWSTPFVAVTTSV
jgi:hypothetical protein